MCYIIFHTKTVSSFPDNITRLIPEVGDGGVLLSGCGRFQRMAQNGTEAQTRLTHAPSDVDAQHSFSLPF
ncbi:hypothetical protein Y032_0675g1427 [Ancylostoma ceylanicum]|uniref:Uncharacterized protein n=1 Tax=Ancylostoma ceylanicum TaxID=53326 RepID=A0A016WIM8_9BILA|nr:hypothetical protein Y032_0675g1427 [Ancylostoma ceylanicum]